MGDYWTVSAGVANHTGHTCRECRGIIYANSPIYVRDGRKIRLFYHEGCFSGNSDPRTQTRSSSHERWEGLSSQAPKGKGYGKWWTSSYGYSGGLPTNTRVSMTSGERSQDPVLKDQAGQRIKQRSVSLLVRSPSNDGSSSSRTLDNSKSRNTYCEGLGWKNVTLQDGDRDDVTLFTPKSSSELQKLPGNLKK